MKEWTSTAVASGVYAIRGGAYNNLEDGRTCDFDFTFGSSIGELQAEKTSYEALTGYSSTHHLS